MQHINLYSQLDRAVTPRLAAIHQLWILMIVSVLMLSLFAVLWFGNKSQADDLKVLQQQQQTTSSQLDMLKAKKQKLLKNATLKNEIKVLQEEIVFRRHVLASVDPVVGISSGFAGHLTGLARQSIEGMWFTEIMLQNGGSDLALLGRTQRAEYLPQYLQKLSLEKVFSGHQFRVFRMKELIDRPGLLGFELRAIDSEQSHE